MNEEEESISIISISDLLGLSFPFSGASSLNSPTSPSSPPLKKLKTLPNPSPSPSPNPKPRSFSPFNSPVLITGTVHLPSLHDPCGDRCFSFSDGSSRVCCSLLDPGDLSFVGKEIRVLAWNFLPFKHDQGGILEIIRWSLSPSLQLTPNVEPVRICLVPLTSHHLSAIGALKSISPIFNVPCKNPGASGDSIGFLAEIITCSCSLCSNYDLKVPLLDLSRHSFANSNFVYFLKPASKWRPVLSMLVGKLVVISGLKKKMIFVGEASYEMFVSMETTVVSLSRLSLGVGSIWMDEGVYNGVVTRVYMQGKAVELDEKVWLLVTSPGIAPPHSIRVGAIVSVKNFHLVHPKFSWIKIHLLGTCARTSIDVKAFSLADTRSYVRTERQSMLGRFMESLTISAKFWLLLSISCFRKKFAKIFSDKEILGSKNQEGLAQVYARGYLDSHFLQSQHGIFKEFCRHEQCTCASESNMPTIKLVTPISNLISKCEALWVSMLSKAQRGDSTVNRDGCSKHVTSKVTSCCCTIRRIVSSEDLGSILMGALKITSTGRLQLVDATGGVDVVIPDLLSNIDGENIYEVKSFKLIMEGSSMQYDLQGFHSVEAWSCRNIFEQFPLKKVSSQLAIYVLFDSGDLTCLNVPFRPPSCKFRNDVFNTTGEWTHLLLITHKFPATENFQGDPLASYKSSLYVEAIVLPYKLNLQEVNEYDQLADVVPGELEEESNIIACNRWLKRIIPFEMSSKTIVDGSNNDSQEVESRLSKIPCLFTFRSTKCRVSPVPGYLCATEKNAPGTTASKQPELRMLLEFKSDSFLKYQLLQIGRYYILKCSDREQCNSILSNQTNHCKIIITPQITLWSLSFSVGGIMHQTNPSQDHSSQGSSLRLSEAYIGNTSLCQMHRNTDVHVHLFSEVKDVLIRTFPNIGEVLSVSSCLQFMKTKVGATMSAVDPQCRDMPQGSLISIFGNIEDIQIFNCNPRPYAGSTCFDRTYIDQRKACDIVIHVSDHHHKVEVNGNMSKNAYPIGMGPGANATFHRLLMTWSSIGCPKLVLTPVSFVVINSIKEFGHQHRDNRTAAQSKFNVLVEESSGIIPLVFISQLSQCIESKLIRFKCRVVNVFILVLDLPVHVSPKSQSKKQLKYPAMNITLAGLMLDDGSSLSCFWVSAGRAERLLRLHETTQKSFFHSRRSSTKDGVKSSRETVGYHLEKMLKKHRRVIVKHNRFPPDSSSLGFTFLVGSEEIFSCSNERLLRQIMLNACMGPVFNIIGTLMDSNSLQLLDAELKVLHAVMPPVPNVWITEVEHLNHLNEARNLLHELTS